MRVEHVQPSRCTEEFRLRKVKNDELKAEAKRMVRSSAQKGSQKDLNQVSW